MADNEIDWTGIKKGFNSYQEESTADTNATQADSFISGMSNQLEEEISPEQQEQTDEGIWSTIGDITGVSNYINGIMPKFRELGESFERRRKEGAEFYRKGGTGTDIALSASAISVALMASGEKTLNTVKDLGFLMTKTTKEIATDPDFELPESSNTMQLISEVMRERQSLGLNVASGVIQMAPYIIPVTGQLMFATDIAKNPQMVIHMAEQSVDAYKNTYLALEGDEAAKENLRTHPFESAFAMAMPLLIAFGVSKKVGGGKTPRRAINDIQVKLSKNEATKPVADAMVKISETLDAEYKMIEMETSRVKTSTPEIEALSEKHNLKYDGVQETPGNKPPLHQFTDKETGTTFYVEKPGEIPSKIVEVRERFKLEQPALKSEETVIPDGEKVATLSLRTEAEAIEAKLTNDFGELPAYKTMNMKEQAQLAQDFIHSDYQAAKRVAMGEEAAPAGIRDASVYEAMKIRALKEGDVNLLRELAVESKVPTKLSEYGQAIKAADSNLISDPVKVMQDIIKTRKEHSKRTGIERIEDIITKEEAARIVELSDDMMKKMDAMEKGGDRFEYGASRVAYERYIDELKGENLSLGRKVKDRFGEFKTTFKDNKAEAVYNVGVDALKTIVNNSVSLVASLDNSFLGRQGLHTLMTHPSVWAKGAKNSFVDIWNTLGGKQTHDALMADVYSRENYLNGSYEKAKILTKTEEQFPTSTPERIPVVGRVFKASQNAFTGSAIRMRTGLFDLLSKKATENGVNMKNSTNLESTGKLINALTARGKWGEKGEPAFVRLFLWAPKMIKGNIDVLTAHGAGLGLKGKFARKEAAINLLKIVTETAAVMTIANALKPGSAELNPTSTDFGKIKVGKTRFDITGGAASLVTLASRILTRSRKSTKTGETIPYGTEFGQTNPFDALVDFVTNKTNPPTRVLVDWLRGEDFKGQPFSPSKSLYKATTPIVVQEAIDLKDEASAQAIAGVILDGFGVSANTYNYYYGEDTKEAMKKRVRYILNAFQPLTKDGKPKKKQLTQGEREAYKLEFKELMGKLKG